MRREKRRDRKKKVNKIKKKTERTLIDGKIKKTSKKIGRKSKRRD